VTGLKQLENGIENKNNTNVEGWAEFSPKSNHPPKDGVPTCLFAEKAVAASGASLSRVIIVAVLQSDGARSQLEGVGMSKVFGGAS
jgi:hypothetical protein